MWKYVAFVVVLLFCVPASFGQEASSESSLVLDPSARTSQSAEPTGSESVPPTTTPPPSPTTTPPPSPTTTPPPSPTTTPPPSPTTTPPTTTPPPTTAAPTTTTVAPTTPLPPPSVGKYAIQDKNKTCLRVEMAVRVNHLDSKVTYNFPPGASTDGSSCNITGTQILELTDTNSTKDVLSLTFAQEEKKNFVSNISLIYNEGLEKVEISGKYFSASEGKSYLCNSDTTVTIGNVTLTFSSVHLQAFGADTFAIAEECDADDKVGDIVPIAVGCALGALVVVVLIAYLVGRRRSRQRGYQSV